MIFRAVKEIISTLKKDAEVIKKNTKTKIIFYASQMRNNSCKTVETETIIYYNK
jgi:molybdopterin synthase catalytic subunit